MNLGHFSSRQALINLNQKLMDEQGLLLNTSAQEDLDEPIVEVTAPLSERVRYVQQKPY